MREPDRDQLIDDVRYGRRTPAEAEAEAVRRGEPPFSIKPEFPAFDPMKERWWTLPMTSAWIAWRSPDLVREKWNAFRETCREWHFQRWRVGVDGPVYEGHFLEPRRPTTIPRMEIEEISNRNSGELPKGSINLHDARAKLWNALADELLQATGVDRATGQRRLIPKEEWRNLRNVEIKGRDVLCRDNRALNQPVFDEVEFPRADVTRLWPSERKGLADFPLPPQITPEGPGYMPLYCAAQWIATRGGATDVDPTAKDFWPNAYTQLLARIASDEVRVVGVKDGKNEQISGDIFASCPVDYPYADAPIDLMLSEELYLCSYPYLDEEHWRNGFDDSLRNRRSDVWRRIMVRKSDIIRQWPFNTKAGGRTSGAPGRPTSMHLVEKEHEGRWERGEANASIREESRILSRWLAIAHPTQPQLKPKSIENHLRTEHRQRQERETRK